MMGGLPSPGIADDCDQKERKAERLEWSDDHWVGVGVEPPTSSCGGSGSWSGD